MEKSDSQLVSESILGNQASFEVLVRRYTQPIYQFSFRRTGDAHLAEDCTQDTFFKAWKNLGKYNLESASFKTWLFIIARRTIIDALRKKTPLSFSRLFGRSPDELAGESYESTIIDESINATPEGFIVSTEDSAMISKYFRKLPEHYQTVLTLHYQEDLTFQEIGDIMKKPTNTVKSWHRRACISLKELLEKHE